MTVEALRGRLRAGMKRAEAMCLREGNQRFASVLATGGLIENTYNDHQFVFCFTGKKPIHYPGVGFLNSAEWSQVSEEEIALNLLQMLRNVEPHGYIEPLETT